MKSLISFISKEITEQMRTGKLVLLLIIFMLFGIMNPAIAKLTPWLLEAMSESLAESGMIITQVKITAMDSWVQFFKNIPICFIVFILIQSSVFTKEYTSGTLVLSLTKGLSRYKVVVSKSLVMVAFWTVGYWLCFGITYLYNSYYWDNSVAQNLIYSAGCWWLFGLFCISLMVLFSVIINSNTGVLAGVGTVVLISYAAALIPKAAKYMPTAIISSNALIYSEVAASEYTVAVIITALLTIICFTVSVPIFNRKSL